LVGKNVADTNSTSESKFFTVNKSILDIVNPTDDFYGVTNADDDQTMFLARSLTDFASAIDTPSLGPRKPFSDSVGKVDAGSVSMTDYWEGYTETLTSVYVGTFITF